MVQQTLDLIKQMTLIEVCDLSRRIRDEFGIAAALPVMAPPAPALMAAPEAEEEKSEWTVALKDFGINKINVIKAIREVTPLGLREAKELVESAPVTVKEGIPKNEAEAIMAKLEEAGAIATIT